MPYLPGTDDAIYPGTDDIKVEQVVEDATHLVVLDLSSIAYPLDGLLPTLARTLADVGLLDAFCAIGRNRVHESIRMENVADLESEPQVARLLQVTLTPEDALRLVRQLDDAALEPAKCSRSGCAYFAVDADFCANHVVDDYPRSA